MENNIIQPNTISHNNKEGKMAKYDAVELSNDASDVANMIQNCTNLPEWVEAKITLSADYMNTVKDYLTHHMHLQEKKIGFNRGPEYSEETIDLLKDFAQIANTLDKELENKRVSNDDPKVQEILNILDDKLPYIDEKFIEEISNVIDIIRELPDKQTQKIGFRNEISERLQKLAGII